MEKYLIFTSSEAAAAACDAIHTAAATVVPGYTCAAWATPMKHPQQERWAVAWDAERLHGVIQPAGSVSEYDRDALQLQGWFDSPVETLQESNDRDVDTVFELWAQQMRALWALGTNGKRDIAAVSAALSSMSLAQRQALFAQSALTVQMLCLAGEIMQEKVGHLFASLGLWDFETNSESIPVTGDLLYDETKDQLK